MQKIQLPLSALAFGILIVPVAQAEPTVTPCISVAAGSGFSAKRCVINSKDTFEWKASDPLKLPASKAYSESVTAGADDKLSNVATVLGYLFEWGIKRTGGSAANNDGHITFYDKAGTSTRTLFFLGQSDESDDYSYALSPDDPYSSEPFSGSFELPDEITANVMVVKGGTAMVVYLFEPAITSGQWETLGIADKDGKQQGLSHVTWWSFEPSQMRASVK